MLKFFIKNKKNLNSELSKSFVKTLWECCQIPDFSKKAYGKHIEIVILEMFLELENLPPL